MRNTRLISILAMAMMAIQACGPKETPVTPTDPDPVFPSSTEKNIKAGERADFNVTANLDWEISIPSSASQYFYIDDAGAKSYKIKGKAGSVSFAICAENVSGNYEMRVCKVTMKMGSQSKEIATVNLLPEVRTISVYTAKTNEDGTFISSGSSEYVYNETASTSLHLTWPAGLSRYMLPIEIASSFSWSIPENYPSWMELSKTSGADGRTAIVISGKATAYPLDDAEGRIEFIDSNDRQVIASIPVKIDGCKNFIRVDCETELIELNLLGAYSQNGGWNTEGCRVIVTATPDSGIISLQQENGKLSYVKDGWVIVTPDPNPAGPEVVQDRVFHILSGENKGAERSAVLLALPGSMLSSIKPEDLIAADGSSVKEEYSGYVFARLVQAGKDPAGNWGIISPVNSKYTMAVKGGGILRTAATDGLYEAINTKFGTDEIYSVYYNNWYSSEDVAINIDEEFTECEFLTPSLEKDWDEYLGIVYPDQANQKIFRLGINYFEDEFESVAVFRKEGKVLAAIICRMSSGYWPDVKYTDIHFTITDYITDPSDPEGLMPKGVILEEIKSGSLYDKYREYDIPVWRMVYQEANPRNTMIYVPPFPANSSESIEISDDAREWLKAEGAITENSKTYLTVTMRGDAPEKGTTGVLVLKGGNRPLFVLQCERPFINQ